MKCPQTASHYCNQEVALDVAVAASVAQGADIVLFFAPNNNAGFIDALTTALYSSPLPLTVLSISWGGSEDVWGDALNQLDELLIEAAALGITVFADSGDWGSNNASNDGSPHVNFPASDPWVTGCGGTFIADPTLTPFTEGTWNDFAIVVGKPSGGATGGGVSASFPVPSWQTGLSFIAFNPATGKAGPPTPLTGRGVPDVADNASPFSGYPIIVYGVTFQIGGTSAVPPLYSALIAMVAANSGGPLGYLNPTLYEIGNTAGQKVLVDIHDGANNEVNPGILSPFPPFAPPSTPCTAYVSTNGWDACTGWGRIDATNLFAVLIETIEATQINPNNPFAFTYQPGSNFTNSWGAAQGPLGQGASNSQSRLECGQFNTADNWRGMAWNTLGTIHMMMGDDEQSRRCYENAIRLLRNLPAATRAYASALANLGSLELTLHQYEEAEVPLRKAQEIDLKAADHVGLQEIAMYRTNFAITRNDMRAARRFLADAFREADKVRDLSLLDRATMYSVAGRLAAKTKDFAAAVADYQQSINFWTQACGSKCYYVGVESAFQADAYRELHDYRKAEDNITEALAVTEQAVGRNAPVYVAMEIIHVHVLRAMGSKAEAAQQEADARQRLVTMRQRRCDGCSISVMGFR